MALPLHKILILLLVIVLSSAYDDDVSGDRSQNYQIVNPFICTPGSRFKLDCNFCGCGPSPGEVGACTRIGCNLGPDECIPESFFLIRGALCKCPACGYKWHSNCFRPRNGRYWG